MISVRKLMMGLALTFAHSSSEALPCGELYRPSLILDQIGIHFEKVTERNIFFKQNHYGSYQTVTTKSYYSEDFVTEVMRFENRLGVHPELIAMYELSAVRGIKGPKYLHWPRDSTGRLYGITNDPTQALKDDTFLRQYMDRAEPGEAFTRAQVFWQHNDHLHAEYEGPLRQDIAEASDFILKHYERRNFASIRAKLIVQWLEFAGQTINIKVKLRDKSAPEEKGAMAGALKIVRAPYGRRAVKAHPDDTHFIKDEVGSWGPAYRKVIHDPLHFPAPRLVTPEDAKDDEIYRLELQARALESAPGDNPQAYHLMEVPMEQTLKRTLKRDAPLFPDPDNQKGSQDFVYWGHGEINELSGLAIDKKLNPRTFAHGYLHLIAAILDPHFSHEFNMGNRIYTTYNDRPRLYTSLGLSKTQEEPTDKLAGADWWELRGTGQSLLEKSLAVKKALLDSDQEALERLKKTVLELSKGSLHLP